MTRVLVCGGREYCDKEKAFAFLDSLDRERGISLVIQGGARGADYIGKRWAEAWGCGVREFPADWERDGKAAGPIRNQRMLDEGQPDIVVAFPGQRGTADLVRRARAAGIEVIEVEG